MMPARSDGWLPKPWYVFLQVLPKEKGVGAEGCKKSWNILAKPPKFGSNSNFLRSEPFQPGSLITVL